MARLDRIYLVRITATLFTGLLLSVAHAEEPTKTSSWTGEIELGFVKTTGNTKTESTKVAAKEVEKWRHSGNLEALKSSDNGNTTAERYFISGKTDYKFSKYEYWYATISYDDDRFSGFDYRVSESAGYGRRLIHEPDLTLDGEIGPGARQTKLDNGDTESELLARLAGNLKWKISDNSEFSEDVFTEIGEDATVSKSETALKANINSSLAMKLSYTIKHTSEVPDGVEKTDTETVVTLVYNYK